MSIFIKSVTAVAAAAVLLAVAAVPAYAANDPVSATVTAGGLTAQVTGATLSSVALDGTSVKHATGPASGIWKITDARGTGAAWGLTASGTDFTSAAGDTDLTPRTLPVGNLLITPGIISSGAGSDAAPQGTPITVSSQPQVIVSATGNFKGTFSLTPNFDLTVPGNAFRSNFVSGTSGAVNPYIATLTLTIA